MPLLSTFGAGSTRGWGRAARLVRPGAPTGFSATGRAVDSTAGGMWVYFTPPVDNGGANITSYQVENTSTGQLFTVYSSGEFVTLNSTSSNSPSTIRVRAVNVAGAGDWSNTDTAISFFVQTGNGTTYSFPANTTVYYKMYSGSGQTYKPDTRVYGNVLALTNWYDNYSYNGGPYHPSPLPYYSQAPTNYSWYAYDPEWNYIYGYYQYAFGSFPNEYFYIHAYGYHRDYGYFSNTNVGGAYTYGYTDVVGGSPPSGPSYGDRTNLYLNGGYYTQTSQGYNGNASFTYGSFTFGGSGGTMRMDHGYSGDQGGGAAYGAYQGGGTFYYGS